jgi:glycosyltransferase involved in cell wall biosynthesis
MHAPRLSALLIASNEICYNPRLLKMADSLLARNVDVSVFSPVVGLAAADLHAECVASRPWHVQTCDISKRSLASRARWLGTSAISRAALAGWQLVGSHAGFHLIWNRCLVGLSWRRRAHDIVVVNLVDNLPIAARIRQRHGSVLVYDSQELFSGEASTLRDPVKARWVSEAERRYIGEADVVMTTTAILAARLGQQFALARPALRVRNAPLEASPAGKAIDEPHADRPVELIWHGFAVHLTGRGVDLLLDAVARSAAAVRLTLQGRLDDHQRRLIQARCDKLGIVDRVVFAPPAHPERIIESLRPFDIGIIAEPGLDENQRLTSSNKLFEYVHAGLAVVAPALPGLAETVEGEQVGVLYRTADAAALAAAIDRIAGDRNERHALQQQARTAAEHLTWANDFGPVWDAVQQALERRRPQSALAGLSEVAL